MEEEEEDEEEEEEGEGDGSVRKKKKKKKKPDEVNKVVDADIIIQRWRCVIAFRLHMHFGWCHMACMSLHQDPHAL